MGLHALRAPLQSPSLQMSIEVSLAACKPEKADACRELQYWHGINIKGGFNLFSVTQIGHIPEAHVNLPRWSSDGQNSVLTKEPHFISTLCSACALRIPSVLGCHGDVVSERMLAVCL